MIKEIVALWISPVQLFESLRDRPRSLWIVVILLVGIALSTFLTVDILMEIGIEKAMEAAAERGADPGEMAGYLNSPFARALPVAVAPITLLLFLVVSAGASYLFLTFTGGVNKEKPFRILFRVAVWAKLVEIPRMLFWTPLVMMKGTAYVFFGPAVLLSGEPHGKMFTLLSALDLFTIWYLALFVLGTKICLSIPTRRAAIVVLVPWVIWNAIKVAIA